MNLKFNRMRELEKRLENFDWYFGWADDYRKYKQGNAEYSRLREYMESLPDQEEVLLLYNKHCPWGKED